MYQLFSLQNRSFFDFLKFLIQSISWFIDYSTPALSAVNNNNIIYLKSSLQISSINYKTIL